jgi:hypothetical protein
MNTVKTFTQKLPQIKTSKATGGKIEDVPEVAWNDANKWVAKRKLDGVRLIGHLTSEGVRLTTRRISEATGEYMERSNNFQHILNLNIADLEGTIIDGEGIAPVDHDVMGATQSMVGASPEHSWEIQTKHGQLEYHLFDIVRFKGTDLTTCGYQERHNYLKRVVETLKLANPGLGTVKICEQVNFNKLNFYRSEIRKAKERETSRIWRAKNRLIIRAKHKIWRDKNKVRLKEREKQYRDKNRERVRQNCRINTAKFLKNHRWISSYWKAYERCNNPHHKSFKNYGAKGIKLLMTQDDFKMVYFKDRAEKMKRAEVHRINNDGHYEISNVVYLEGSDHRRAHQCQILPHIPALVIAKQRIEMAEKKTDSN